MEIFTAVINALAALGAAAAALVAFLGLNAWRQQLRGNVEFDAARRALLAAYKVRDAIRTFRNPFHSIQEIGASGAKADEPYERSLYARRWEEVGRPGRNSA